MNRAPRNRHPRSAEPRLDVSVSYAARRPWVPRPADFIRWALAAVDSSAVPQSLSVRVVGLATSRSLNQRYRHKPKATNVLSFTGAGCTPDGWRHLGELVICAPVVAREAPAGGVALRARWALMTVHGVLHLRGFDHERDEEAHIMQAKEVQLLDQLGFPNPYA